MRSSCCQGMPPQVVGMCHSSRCNCADMPNSQGLVLMMLPAAVALMLRWAWHTKSCCRALAASCNRLLLSFLVTQSCTTWCD